MDGLLQRHGLAATVKGFVKGMGKICFKFFIFLFHDILPNITQQLIKIRWRFGSVCNVVGRINEINQRRAWLVLGWVTVCRQVNHLRI